MSSPESDPGRWERGLWGTREIAQSYNPERTGHLPRPPRPFDRQGAFAHPWWRLERAGMDPDIDQAGRTPDEAIEITVPGADRYLEVLRGVVGRAARICGFSYAGIEDFSLAVDETAVLLLDTRPEQLSLRLERVTPASGALTARLTVHSPGAEWPPKNVESDLRWQILTALSEEVWVLDGEERGVGLSQSVR